MATTEERIRKMVEDNWDVQGKTLDIDANLADLKEVSSSDMISFFMLLNKEFNVTILPEDFAKLTTMKAMIDHIDSQSG